MPKEQTASNRLPNVVRRRLLQGAAAGAVLAAARPLRAQEDPVRIGVPTALEQPEGRDTVDAVQMAVAQINEEGGLLGRQLEVRAQDETLDPRNGVAAIETLLGEKVDVLIGGYTSGVTLAQLHRIATARTVFLSCGGASPAITQRVLEDYDRFKYVFRVHPLNAAHQARALVEFIGGFLVAEMHYARIAIVGEDDKWVAQLMPVLARNASAVGAEVRLTEIVGRETTDFSALLEKIQSSGAHFVLTLFAQIASDRFVRQWAQSGVTALVGGIDARAARPQFFASVQGDAAGQIVAGFAVRAPVTPHTVPFWDAFVARTGRPGPAPAAMGAYDAVHVYVEAVRRAATLEADALVEALKQTDHVGVTGRIQFDEGHDLKAGAGLANLLFSQWQDSGERVVLWPRELRTGKPFVPPLRRRY